MAHDHHHGHACPSHQANERRTLIAASIIGSFMLVEVVGGVLSGSLALLADAGHMVSDFGSLLLAFFAFRLARKPADRNRTFGYDRTQILAAFVNGIALIGIGLWIVVEAIRRAVNPVDVLPGPMLIIAIIGLLVNILAFVVLTRGSGDNINLRAAALHVLADMLGSVAAIGAAIAIALTGISFFDPLLSVLVALLVIHSGWKIAAQAGHVLLEGTPNSVDPDEIERALAEIDGVTDVHHLHVWSLTAERMLATVHLVCEDRPYDQIRTLAVRMLDDRFNIGHPTIQIESVRCY